MGIAVVGVVVRGVLGDHGEVAAWHGNLVVIGGFGVLSWVPVKQLEKRFVGLVVKVMDLIPPCEEVRHGSWRRLVDNGRRHHVCHIAEVVFDRDLEVSPRVKSSKCCQVDITSEDGNANRELGADALESVNELIALLLVGSGSVMVVKIVQKVNTSIETVEEATAQTNSPVQELDRAEKRAGKDIFEPRQTLTTGQPRPILCRERETYRIRNWHTQKNNKMLDWIPRTRCLGKFLFYTSENRVVRLRVVDLVPRALYLL